MPGTGPRQRAVIALSFGVQAVLIAGALTLPAEMSSTVSVSSSSGSSGAVPEPVTLLPVVSPLVNGVPPGSVSPVTVKIDAATSTWTPLSGPSVFLIEPGPDMSATVTLTVPDGSYLHSLSFNLADEGPLQAPALGSAAATRNLLSVPGPLSPGTYTFTLHLGNLAPRSGKDITMTVTRPGNPGVASDVIAEIVTN